MVQVTEISHYDERSPAWYWNSLVTDATSCANR